MFKKILYIALSMAILLSAFAFNQVLAENTYIEIYTAKDMTAIADNPSCNYMLMADIDMSVIDWQPIEFSGIFDGSNHTLYNLALDNLSQQSYITVDWHHNEYDTYFASLFSKCENAQIQNLNLVNVTADIQTDEHCFVAGIAGIALNTEIINCHVDARLNLTTTNQMVGIGGMVGFGEGTVRDSSVNLVAVLVDNNPAHDTEEFIGGIWATGYPTIENCNVVMDSYATTFSYAHDGGIIGMHRVYVPGLAAYRHISDCTVDVTLNYMEHNAHGHRHYGTIAGERINPYLEIKDNTTLQYTANKCYDYDLILRPCMCDGAVYTEEVTTYTCTNWGYTTYTCETCGYSYLSDYTPPEHTIGEWERVSEPTYAEDGIMIKSCTICGEVLDEKSIPQLIYVDDIGILGSAEINYKDNITLVAEISPSEAADTDVVWASSDENVATVNNTGNVTAVGRGEAKITCTSADGNTSASCNITVKYSFWQWLIVILLFGWVWY